jgi:hypothetical protein
MLLMSMLLLAGVQEAEKVDASRVDAGSVDAVLADYHALTTTSVHCVKPKDDTEIVVCSLRKADNYRVPLVLSSSPKNSVQVRNADLLDVHRPPCGEGAFMAQCGYVGVSVSTNGTNVHWVRRDRAP